MILFISVHCLAQGSDQLTSSRWIEEQLKIGDISNSTDVDLRLFLGRGITNGGHVIRIARSNGRWEGMKYDYFLKMRKGLVTQKIKKTIETKLSSVDWESLWSHLIQLDILTLPDQDSIEHKLRKEVTTIRGEGYSILVINDGSSYDLIVKNEGKISKYSFYEPWTYSRHYPDVDEVRKYSQIIETLEKELAIDFR